MNVALDRRAFADDELVFRDDLSVEAPVDAHRVFEFELSFEHCTAVEKAVQFTAGFTLHRFLPVKSSKMRIKSSSLEKRI